VAREWCIPIELKEDADRIPLRVPAEGESTVTVDWLGGHAANPSFVRVTSTKSSAAPFTISLMNDPGVIVNAFPNGSSHSVNASSAGAWHLSSIV
jgi:hypothetical protein